MHCVANRVYVADEYGDAFIERFREQADRVESQPGFIKVELLEPVDAPCYIIQSYWESEEAFDEWVDSDAFREAHARPFPDDMFTAENEIERYEVKEAIHAPPPTESQ